MTIDLGIEVLESIVKDGIQEIMRKFCGVGGRRAKTRAWFKAAKEAVRDYEKSILEDFLPVLVRDFRESVVVKFASGKMNEEDIRKLKMFMDMVEKSNFSKLEVKLLESIED